MILYLDQRDIIELTLNKEKLEKLFQVIQSNKIKLGISFSHIFETVNADEEKRESIIKTLEYLGYVELTHIINIVDMEMKNEFYRYIKLPNKIVNFKPISSIFSSNFKIKGFGKIVRYFSKNPRYLNNIQQHKINHENKIRELLKKKQLPSVKKQLENERDNLLNDYINNFLKEENLDLVIKLPRRSLDAIDFKRKFFWERCPYSQFYTIFQTLKYRDKTRDPKGDLGNLEHAAIGAISCDVLCIEKNACEIIKQCKKYDDKMIIARTFNTLTETIKYLENN